MKNLILLHGAIGASDQFDELKTILSKIYKVYTLDFSGHGQNQNITEPFSIENFSRDLNDFITANKIEQANIFGYSMGGYVALHYILHYPNKIEKIFTFATKFEWTIEIAAKEVKLLNPEIIQQKIPAFANVLEKRHGEKWKMVLAKTKEMMLKMGENPPLTTTDLNRITLPILFGVGDSDQMVSIEETIKFRTSCNDSSLLILPQTEHPFEKIKLMQLCIHIQSFFN